MIPLIHSPSLQSHEVVFYLSRWVNPNPPKWGSSVPYSMAWMQISHKNSWVTLICPPKEKEKRFHTEARTNSIVPMRKSGGTHGIFWSWIQYFPGDLILILAILNHHSQTPKMDPATSRNTKICPTKKSSTTTSGPKKNTVELPARSIGIQCGFQHFYRLWINLAPPKQDENWYNSLKSQRNREHWLKEILGRIS